MHIDIIGASSKWEALDLTILHPLAWLQCDQITVNMVIKSSLSVIV